MLSNNMGVQNLQNFIDGGHVEGCSVSAELLKIARNFQRPNKQNRNKPNSRKLALVLDAECCLDRLYGGYFSDWTCGGQWNRMFQYLSQLILSCQNGNIELTVAFNGALEMQRMSEWTQKQLKSRAKVNLVLRHLHNKGTPPPKVWWVPPVCLTTALRMALRYYNVPVMCSMDDHHQEVLAYCRENNLHGIIGDDAEYIVFDPPRYFSASSLKLTYKGSIETKEFVIGQLAKGLDLTPDKLCVVAALLGNYLLSEAQLAPLHNKIGVYPSKNPLDVTVRGVAAFVKSLDNTDNLEALAADLFGSDKTGKKRQSFIESVQYYLNGTKEGFLKYKPRKSHKNKVAKDGQGEKKKSFSKGGVGSSGSGEPTEEDEGDRDGLDSSRFASETLESEAGSLEAYKIATAHTSQGKLTQGMGDGDHEVEESVDHCRPSARPDVNGVGVAAEEKQVNGGLAGPLTAAELKNGSTSPVSSVKMPKIPPTPPEVLRTACERHQKGLMSPAIYQILTQGEVKLPVVIEEEGSRDIPSVHSIYKPVRQNVYAILFNLHHQMYIAANKEKDKEKTDSERPGGGHAHCAAAPAAGADGCAEQPEVWVREWTCTPGNQYSDPSLVKAEPIGWPVPTIQRLWFGTNIDDMRRRLRAFLTCMKSDSPLMVSSSYVPQHLLVMASVLRFLMQVKPPILRKAELDSFIVTAFSPDLMNAEFTQELQLQVVSSRGVQLATVLMQGVETALIANDACGAPIPWLMCCPWLYFDGKLLHNILAKTEHVKSLQELCNHRLDVLVKVERMRHAILENLTVTYARRPLPNLTGLPFSVSNMPPAGYNPALEMPRRGGPTAMRGPARRPVPSRGGQLEVAGVVVGSWGPNYSLNRTRLASPQVTSVGGLRNYGRQGYQSDRAGYPSFSRGPGGFHKKRLGGVGNKKGKNKRPEKKRESRGRGITDENTNSEKVGDNLESSSGEENPDQFEDAPVVTEAAAKMTALSLERGQGDHSLE